MKYSWLILLSLVISCKEKPKYDTDTTNFFPVLSLIKSQVAHIDSSMYEIIKVVSVDSLRDTIYLQREDFRREAQAFLNLPDLTESETGRFYTEERILDETLNRIIINYSPLKEGLKIERQELLIAPGGGAEGSVESIIINTREESGDSVIARNMLWKINKFFQVVKIVEKEDLPVRTTRTEVIWQ